MVDRRPQSSAREEFAPGGLVGESHDNHTQPHHRLGPRQGRRRSLIRRDLRAARRGFRRSLCARVNDTLTLDFADATGTIAGQHYAFHVNDAEFDAILQRVKDAGLAFGSGPRSLEDGKLNGWNGGRGFYYKDHDGHVVELMSMPQ